MFVASMDLFLTFQYLRDWSWGVETGELLLATQEHLKFWNSHPRSGDRGEGPGSTLPLCRPGAGPVPDTSPQDLGTSAGHLTGHLTPEQSGEV